MWDGTPYVPKDCDIKKVIMNGQEVLVIEAPNYHDEGIHFRGMMYASYVLVRHSINYFSIVKDRSGNFLNSVVKKEYPSAYQHIIGDLNPIRFSLADDDELMLLTLMLS
jgi:hypothetical protein